MTAVVAASRENRLAEDARRANEVLRDLQRKYRYLEDVTVSVGETPRREQAVAYYMDGEILVDHGHSAPTEKILAHEIWHVIDWRDNGRLDWGEDLPPDNASDYLK